MVRHRPEGNSYPVIEREKTLKGVLEHHHLREKRDLYLRLPGANKTAAQARG